MKQEYESNGMNKNTDKLLFTDKYYDENDEKTIKNSLNLSILERYTRFREKSIFTKLLMVYYKAKYSVDFSKITYNEEKREYEYIDPIDGEVYTFNKLSNILNDPKTKNELQSKNRHHKCHEKSMELMISNVVPKGYIVTGYLKRGYGKFLHSVIEIEKTNGELYIIDYTKNLFMKKDQYFKLTNFEEIERISEEEYLDDLLLLDLCPDLITGKEYLTFRSEIIRDLQKNMFLFEGNEELKETIETLKRRKKELMKELEEDEER